MTDTISTGFASLGLPFPILRTLEELGYETPSAIQEHSIPPVSYTHLTLPTTPYV